MSGVKLKDLRRRVPDSNIVCLLQCAHPPGQPLRLWYYNGSLSEVQEEKDHDALSVMWDILLNEDTKRGKG